MDYIRAVFRQKIVDEDDREKRSQSLSNQGSLSTRLLVALAAFVSCRNPFLIRAVFRPTASSRLAGLQRRNPFLIRAVFRRKGTEHGCADRDVAIPF